MAQIQPQKALVTRQPALIAQVAQIANAHAAGDVFRDYRSRKAINTLSRQDDDLAAFADYLHKVKIKTSGEQLATNPAAWQGITWGIVKGFAGYLLGLGYSTTSLNPKLSTIKTYCRLAMQAGVIPASDYTQIKAITGYSRLEGQRIDRDRETTRVGAKKADARVLTLDEVDALIDQPPTPQGRRDRVLLLLMLDLGLRVGEVVALKKRASTSAPAPSPSIAKRWTRCKRTSSRRACALPSPPTFRRHQARRSSSARARAANSAPAP